MKSNLRNEIKSYIVRQGMTMQGVVDLLHDEHGWSDSVSNLSNKLQRESLRYTEAVQLADALRYEIVWQRKKNLLTENIPKVPPGRRAHFYTWSSPVCASCGAYRPDSCVSGLFCVTLFRTRGWSPPETRAPLRCLRIYPCPLCSGNHLLTQTISTAKSEQLFHQF